MSVTGARIPKLQRRHVRQFAKFGMVGASGVIVNLVVAIIMHRLNGGTINARRPLLPVLDTGYFVRYIHLVWIVSFLVANMWNFQLNRWWTFRGAKDHGSWGRQFLAFLAVGSVAAAAGLVIITVLTHPNSPVQLPSPPFTEEVGLRSRYYWAQLLTIVMTMPINFVVNKLWTFKPGRVDNNADPDS